VGVGKEKFKEERCLKKWVVLQKNSGETLSFQYQAFRQPAHVLAHSVACIRNRLSANYKGMDIHIPDQSLYYARSAYFYDTSKINLKLMCS
jgi:hypothetical protein